MSIRGTIFKEIQNRLMTAVPGIQWADKDRGQLEDPGNHVFPRPAVFFSFGLGQYENNGGNILLGEKTLRVRTCVENYTSSHHGSVNIDKALAFFDFNEAVQKALQGFSGTNFGNLSLIADEDDLDHTNLIVTLLEFSFTLTDDSANTGKDLQLVDPDPTLIVNKTKIEDMPQEPPFTGVGVVIPVG
ncbi:hypothetical protein MAR621_03136 [Maribacter dokdonensis]|uniref:hypothetical protein n=1 Tax=Maribacter dokdonensis TaxID=320912 RepID=UPI001B115E87|nr:hypothetical protein [Maribacter dokdonensis]CAG2532942.1 hypothetical protein MAR621_03136 [Maribacter dokdonensis]